MDRPNHSTTKRIARGRLPWLAAIVIGVAGVLGSAHAESRLEKALRTRCGTSFGEILFRAREIGAQNATKSLDSLRFGEWVHLSARGDPKKKIWQPRLRLVSPAPGGPKVMPTYPSPLPGVGRFVAWHTSGAAVVDVTRGREVYRVFVPRELLKRVASGDRENFERLAEAYRSPLVPKPGDRVRYRDFDGRIFEGSVARIGRSHLTLETRLGTERISRTEVFAPVEGRSRTPSGFLIEDVSEAETPDLHPFVPLRFDASDPVMRKFLDGAAHLTSYPEYRTLSTRRRLETLVEYIWNFVPYDFGASWSEFYGLRNLSQNVCAGAGTCRHQSTLLAAVLAEAGFDVRLTGRWLPAKEKGYGHRWLEVVRGDEHYVLDVSAASPGLRVLPLAEVQASARRFRAGESKSGGFADTYLANPARRTYPEF